MKRNEGNCVASVFLLSVVDSGSIDVGFRVPSRRNPAIVGEHTLAEASSIDWGTDDPRMVLCVRFIEGSPKLGYDIRL